MRGVTRVLALGLLVAVGGCAIEPQPVHLGAEECAHCRMVISEPQFMAQALNSKGKAYKFDAVECLARWVRAGEVPEAEIHSIWVADHEEPESWVRVEDAVFLRTDAIHTPMGMGVVALRDAAAASELRAARGGELLDWNGVLEAAAGASAHAHSH